MKRFLVIGNPIEHSLSPTLHNYWIKNNAIDAIYEKKKLDENELGQLIVQIKKEKIDGVNVTVPFKKIIIPFLDELSIEAEKTQSVNTLYLKNNKVVGHNTDIIGFKTSIEKSRYDIFNKEILILGAGGVVPSIIFALNKMKVSKIKVSNRTKEKVENLKENFKNIELVEWGEVSNFDMIINATSIGLKERR
jgi:shikimate dehydrogenase